MDRRRALLVDAFTTEPLSGNVAGVVPDADGLDAEQMRAVAGELGASETAFVCSSASADRRIRYFTPTQEIDLCGHATIAAHAHLAAERAIEPGTHTLETNVGTLDIEIGELGEVWMTQDAPTVRPLDVDYDRIAEMLGVDVAALRDVGADLPVALASTGLPFVVVPVNFLEHLSGSTPDMDAIAEFAAEHDAAGVYAFTFDAIDADSTLHARCFAPGVGITEDPATGTASGACGAYLRQVGAFDSVPDELRFEQGHFVDRPSLVRVTVDEQIRVGGRAVQSLDGEVTIPEFDTDDIIEA
ncbi:PhzF family phenazine biosynthesis isomerase [Haloferax sp. MBLA0076]|uniref:PhzF family phenazine biosynthesis isomerase n=1 Tax=Haloferax litoreum TaxID=2666140 RepID=A0A6A8GC62_9EURY|nr:MULTISPECIES: PhzF family phenazine biosynthesis protein [Haloferax]KAB1192252.1 PhzF family phenazine biosynthesis protein [Haloferax sp. CBA1148]MRX20708.1 PhzF family phenazine biosynthesis isomerase [Haloferax litoreum]